MKANTVLARVRGIAFVAALLAGAQAARADECLFVGEILDAERPASVRLLREGRTDGRDDVFQYQQLLPGDTIEVLDGQEVVIRDAPGSRRTITRSDGVVAIGQPDDCDIRPGFWERLAGVPAAISNWSAGGMAAEPAETRPRGNCPVNLTIALDLEGRQVISADLDRISVFWHETAATARLQGPSGDATVVGPGGRLLADLDWPEGSAPMPGELWRLDLDNGTDKATVEIEIVAEDQGLGPIDAATLANLTGEERALLAIWLATEGPAERRLQGWSMLNQLADDHYAAWRIWRGIRAASPYTCDE